MAADHEENISIYQLTDPAGLGVPLRQAAFRLFAVVGPERLTHAGANWLKHQWVAATTNNKQTLLEYWDRAATPSEAYPLVCINLDQ